MNMFQFVRCLKNHVWLHLMFYRMVFNPSLHFWNDHLEFGRNFWMWNSHFEEFLTFQNCLNLHICYCYRVKFAYLPNFHQLDNSFNFCQNQSFKIVKVAYLHNFHQIKVSILAKIKASKLCKFGDCKGPTLQRPLIKTLALFQEWNHRHTHFGHLSGNRVRIGVSCRGNYFGFAIPSRTRKRIGS